METSEMLKVAFQEQVVGRTQAYEWFFLFQKLGPLLKTERLGYLLMSRT
jgi:hypothetical protein